MADHKTIVAMNLKDVDTKNKNVKKTRFL